MSMITILQQNFIVGFRKIFVVGNRIDNLIFSRVGLCPALNFAKEKQRKSNLSVQLTLSLVHQTGIIRTLRNQGSYFSLQGITSVFKSPADKRIARSFYTRSYGLFSFIWLYTKPDFFAFRGG